MKILNPKTLLASASVAAMVLTGCGGGGGGGSETANGNTGGSAGGSTSTRTVKVVDAYVVGAVVVDADGRRVGISGKGGIASDCNESYAFPLSASGGFFDANNNGLQDPGETNLPAGVTLQSPQCVISPLTTLITNGADPQKLAELLGVDPAKLYSDPLADNDIQLEKAVQIAYGLIAGGSMPTFIYNVNQLGGSDLPSFGGANNNTMTGSLDAFANLAITSSSNNSQVMSFINDVLNLQTDSSMKIETLVEGEKSGIVSMGGGFGSGTGNSSTSSGSGGGASSMASSVASSISSAASSMSSTASSIAGGSDIPNFADFTNPSHPSSSSQPSDLPGFGSSNSSSSSSSSSISSSSSSSTSSGSELPNFSY